MRPGLTVLALCLAALSCSGPPAPAPASPPPASPPPAAAPASPEPARSSAPLDILPRGVTSVPAAAPGQHYVPLNQVDPGTLKLVRSYTQRFYDGELDDLFERFSPEMREQISRAQLTQMRDYALDHYGKETRLILERAAVNETYRGFVRWAQFDKVKEVIEIIWYLKPDDSIGGFFVRPAKRPAPDQTGAAPDATSSARESG